MPINWTSEQCSKFANYILSTMDLPKDTAIAAILVVEAADRTLFDVRTKLYASIGELAETGDPKPHPELIEEVRQCRGEFTSGVTVALLWGTGQRTVTLHVFPDPTKAA